jgi:hypothetical protein
MKTVARIVITAAVCCCAFLATDFSRGIRETLAGSVPQAILDRPSDDELVQQYELKRVAVLKRFDDERLKGK